MKKTSIFLIFLILFSSFAVAVDIGYGKGKAVYIGGNEVYGLLKGDNTWTGNQIFDGNVTINNATIINYKVVNVTGNVTATDYCFLNGTCVSSAISELNDSIIQNSNDINTLNTTIESLDNTYLTLSGDNANQNIDISPYNITANNLCYSDGTNCSSSGGEIIWNISEDNIIPINNSKTVKIVANKIILPNITGTLTLGYFDASSDGVETGYGGEIIWKVYGYKNYDSIRLFSANYLTQTIDGSLSPYDYIGTTATLTGANTGDYDGFYWEYYDDEEFYTIRAYGDTYAYVDDDEGFYPDEIRTSDLPINTDVAYDKTDMLEVTSIVGEDTIGTIDVFSPVRHNENVNLLKNLSVEGTTNVVDLTGTGLLSFGTAFFPSLASTSTGQTATGIGSNGIIFRGTSYSRRFYWSNSYGYQFNSPVGHMYYYDDGSFGFINNGLAQWIFRSGNGQESWNRNISLTMGALSGGSSLLGSDAERLNIKTGNMWIYENNAKILLSPEKNASISWTGNDLQIDSDYGNVLFYDGTDWKDVEADSYIEHSWTTSLTDKEAYELVEFAENNNGNNGNYSAWGECYSIRNITDMSKPVNVTYNYTEEIDINGTLENQTFYYNRTEHPYNKTSEGTYTNCKSLMIQKAQSYERQAIQVYDNFVNINKSVSAEEYWTATPEEKLTKKEDKLESKYIKDLAKLNIISGEDMRNEDGKLKQEYLPNIAKSGKENLPINVSYRVDGLGDKTWEMLIEYMAIVEYCEENSKGKFENYIICKNSLLN